MPRSFCAVFFLLLGFFTHFLAASEPLNLTQATIISRAGNLPAAEKIAPVILREEVFNRSGSTWETTDLPDPDGTAQIFLASAKDLPQWSDRIPASILSQPLLKQPEGFCIQALPGAEGQPDRLFIVGSDPRGVMFGVGYLLRKLNILSGKVTIPPDFQVQSAPDRAIRGHQIGYRPRANSWDAWTVDQFDQYFRDMVVFGANCMENIPFQDDDPHPLMKYSRDEMNIEFAKLCLKYDLDHWVWIPVEFSVKDDPAKAEAFLKQQEAFYKACPRLDAIFVPGGDPGDNPCKPLMPYLEKMAAAAQKHHPKAKIWLSLQGFHGQDIEDFYTYINQHDPEWFGGAVMGPSSPAMEITRQRLPSKYPLRWYPDITHIVRCQYPIPWLDPIWGLTIGREGVNPRPLDYAAIYENDYRLTDGFLSYSDGIHDDFNKNLWSQLAWDPHQPVREIARDYARYFFRSDLGEIGADALLGLEADLQGPIVSNGSVEGTFHLWKKMEEDLETDDTDWRFDMHLFRAYYDAYTRARAIDETRIEKETLEILRTAYHGNTENVILAALAHLKRPETHPTRTEWFARLESLADLLFNKIGYQTSVPKYQASGYERGCMMDYVRYPLNNRWWIEDQLNLIAKLKSEPERIARLDRIINWDNPGHGGYYEALGYIGKSFHMIKLTNAGDAMRHYYEFPMPTQRNIGPQRNGLRLSFHIYHDLIPSLKYDALDPQGSYTVKLFAQRESPLMIDGVLAQRIRKGDTYEQVTEQEFEVPAEALKDGKIELTWAPLDQRHLNWRQHHYVTDLWILRK